MLKGDCMERIYQNCSEDVFTISQPVYNALHPIEQLMARALERVGKVRIVKEDESSIW
jgi:hypothetical protein